MIRSMQLKSGVIVFAFLLMPAVAPASAKDKWLNVATKNFNIISNAEEKETRELALKLEQFHQVYSALFRLKNPNTVPITVMVFKNDDSFKPFKPVYNGKPANISGYFQESQDENLIALNLDAGEEHPMAVIFHEYTHLLTKTQREWPLWLREGIAELYSTFDVEKNEVTLGKPISGHVYLLRQSKLMPLELLFMVTNDSSAYNESEKQGIFYAQSWALTHYLMFGDTEARRPQMVEFVKLIHAGVMPDTAFKQAFKTDFATVEKELRKYVSNNSYSGTVYTVENAEGAKDIAVSPLGEAEVQFYLGNLLLRTDRIDEAEPYFKQAAALNPALARTSEGLGFLAIRRKKYDEALKHFEQAISQGSKNYLAYYYYAEAIQEQARGKVTPEASKKMVDALKVSIKLMPGFEESYYLLGFAYLSSGENLKEGAELLKTAMRMAPQERRFSITLAQLQVRAQDYAAAKKTLEPLLASDVDQGLRTAAESIMKVVDYYIEAMAAPPAESTGSAEDPAKAESPVIGGQPGGQGQPTGGRPLSVSGQPTVRIEGAKILRGVLVRIECVSGRWTLVVQVENQLLRFMVSDKEKLEFYSQDPSFNGKIGCGTVAKLAFIYFKPIGPGKSKFHGDAMAVEFTR